MKRGQPLERPQKIWILPVLLVLTLFYRIAIDFISLQITGWQWLWWTYLFLAPPAAMLLTGQWQGIWSTGKGAAKRQETGIALAAVIVAIGVFVLCNRSIGMLFQATRDLVQSRDFIQTAQNVNLYTVILDKEGLNNAVRSVLLHSATVMDAPTLGEIPQAADLYVEAAAFLVSIHLWAITVNGLAWMINAWFGRYAARYLSALSFFHCGVIVGSVSLIAGVTQLDFTDPLAVGTSFNRLTVQNITLVAVGIAAAVMWMLALKLYQVRRGRMKPVS